MIKKACYPVDFILSLIGEGNPPVDLDGDIVRVSSVRLLTFKQSGTRCIICGKQGSFFVKEKTENDKCYHLNLYSTLSNGKHILMTKDHMIPKSKGGKNHTSNTQTMCTKCNGKKSDRPYTEIIIKRTKLTRTSRKTIPYIDGGHAYV